MVQRRSLGAVGWSEAGVSVVFCRESGRLAQLGEHRVRNAGVVGSNPMPSTRVTRPNSLP
jgi:hypothetical protein